MPRVVPTAGSTIRSTSPPLRSVSTNCAWRPASAAACAFRTIGRSTYRCVMSGRRVIGQRLGLQNVVAHRRVCERQTRRPQAGQGQRQRRACHVAKVVPLHETADVNSGQVAREQPDRTCSALDAGVEEQPAPLACRGMRNEPRGHRQDPVDQTRDGEAPIAQEAPALLTVRPALVPAFHHHAPVKQQDARSCNRAAADVAPRDWRMSARR